MADTERKTITEHVMEGSKKLDNVFIVGGLGMMAIGIIYNPLLVPGVVLAGGSVATKWGAEGVRRWSEKRRTEGRSNVLYQHNRSPSGSISLA